MPDLPKMHRIKFPEEAADSMHIENERDRPIFVMGYRMAINEVNLALYREPFGGRVQKQLWAINDDAFNRVMRLGAYARKEDTVDE